MLPKFVFLSVFTVKETICPKIWVKRSKTSLLKLTTMYFTKTWLSSKKQDKLLILANLTEQCYVMFFLQKKINLHYQQQRYF